VDHRQRKLLRRYTSNILMTQSTLYGSVPVRPSLFISNNYRLSITHKDAQLL
jgi:hypothetical protein